MKKLVFFITAIYKMNNVDIKIIIKKCLLFNILISNVESVRKGFEVNP